MKLKVISFNIRCCDDKDGNTVAQRAPRLSTVTEPYDADVIGFQEYTPLWEEHIAKYYGDKYEIFNIYRTNTGHIESPPMLWKKDKFECIKKGCFWLSDTPEVMSGGWDTYGHNRTCEYAILKDKESGKKFTFMNTHFGFGNENQIKSAKLICDYADKLSDLPTFVTGDFNATPASDAYAEMVKRFTDSNGATVNDRRSTYHGYDPSVARDEHIDYCFVNEKIKPVALRIIDETVEGKYPTDHFGVYIELDI
jgi:endonuclease/exonuclease/phosphatase family metal-dependent hydrolase